MTDDNRYDAVIIGAGHNGLVAATYLARAGKRVIVVEALNSAGGACSSERFNDDYIISPCAQYLNQLDGQVRKDLALDSHGLSVSASPLNKTLLASDGQHIFLDQGKASGGLGAKDQAAFAKFHQLAVSYSKALMPLLKAPPPDMFAPDRGDKMMAAKLAWALRGRLGKDKMRDLLRIITMNIYDWLNEHFDSGLLKGGLSLDACMGHFAGPRTGGTVLNYLYQGTNGYIDEQVDGGMGSVAKAIEASARAAGAEIRFGEKVVAVNVDQCRVSGVQLNSGQTIDAAHIVSSIDLKKTVLGLAGAKHFEADFVHSTSHVRARGMTARLHLALDGLPDFTDLPSDRYADRLIIAPSARAVDRAFDCAKYGNVSDHPMMDISLPSVSDPTLAPQGHHVLSATVQYAPYDLRGGWSDSARAMFRKACIDRIADYAPNIYRHIVAAELFTPTDFEDRYGLPGGHWHQGEMALDQMAVLRPVPAAPRYALPLDGLYLCGASAHPGGGVMGLCGKLAAEALLMGEKA